MRGPRPRAGTVVGSSRMRRCRLPGGMARLAALVLTLAISLTAVSSASAARGMEVGLQDDAVFLYQSYYNRDLALQQAKQLGVTRLRVNVLWNRVASAQERQRMAPAQ